MVVHASEYNLKSTFESSFAQYLFQETVANDRVVWTGLVPPLRGSEIFQQGSDIHFKIEGSVENDIVDYLTRYVTGLWHTSVLPDYPPAVTQLLADQPGIRVPWLFRNKWHVLLSTLLSIHSRVSLSRAWFAALHHFSIDEIAASDPLTLRDLTQKATGISAGFRMRYVIETARALISSGYNSLDDLSNRDPALVRTILLGIRNLGPKVVDCFLLNAMGDLSAVPIDVHVGRVAVTLGLVPNHIGHPQHYLCRQYVCRQEDSERTGIKLCPKARLTQEIVRENNLDTRHGCIRAALSQAYPKAGWLQAYLFRFGHSGGLPYRRQREEKLPRLKRVSRPPEIRAGWPEVKVFQFFPESRLDIEASCEAFIQKLASEKNLRRNRAVEAFVLWKLCRDKGLPLLLSEVQESFNVKYSEIIDVMKLLDDVSVQPLNCDAIIEIVQRELNLAESVVNEARAVLSTIRRVAQNPRTAVALAIYSGSKRAEFKLTQKQIARSLHLTEVTIRNGLGRLPASLREPVRSMKSAH